MGARDSESHGWRAPVSRESSWIKLLIGEHKNGENP
jgi:hypothetical protein